MALWRDGRVLARRFIPMARGQSEALMPMAAEVLAEAGLGFADIGLLGVTVGPGAFTGLRIGLAAARAMALAAGLPVAGVTTTEAVAHAVPEAERAGRTILAVVESKREELWVQAFAADLTPLGEIEALTPAAIAARIQGPVVACGDGAGRLPPLPGDAVLSTALAPDAVHVAAVAAARWTTGRALPPSPLYLRAPDVTLPSQPPVTP